MDRGEVTLENLRNGLERFNKEHGHYPTAEEIDSCQYLPSARWIQYKFGGLKKLRNIFGFNDLDYRTFRHELIELNFLSNPKCTDYYPVCHFFRAPRKPTFE